MKRCFCGELVKRPYRIVCCSEHSKAWAIQKRNAKQRRWRERHKDEINAKRRKT